MVNWNEVFYNYILGSSHITLASKFNIQLNKIRNRAKKEEWLKKRNSIKEKVNYGVDKKLDNLAKRAFSELESILADECSSATSKIQAAKTIIDIAGVKKEKKETSKDINYEVFINRECVKCK